MITGAIIGLIGSVIPEVLRLYKDRSDKKHELEMMKMQIEYAKEMTLLKMEEARQIAQIELDKSVYEFARPLEIKPTGFKLADTLQAIGNFANLIVRPVITFLSAGLWFYGMVNGYQFSVWEQDVITCIIVFWFGNRSFQRAFGRVNR